MRALREQTEARRRAQSGIEVSPLDLLHDKQREVSTSSERFRVLLVGRRGGKTVWLVRDLANILLTEQDTTSTYISQTSITARELCWHPLQQAARAYGWPISFNNSTRIATGPHGARLVVGGSETIRDIENKRGPGFRHMRVDECGAIRPSYLRYMVEDVLEPMMMDSADSDIVLSGTPGPACTGYWWEVSTGEGDAEQWPTFSWTWQDNPHLDPTFVPQLMKRRGWDESHPTYQREYLARWYNDPSRVVFRWDWARNCVERLPKLHITDEWHYAFGLDFGVGDATALVVIAYPASIGSEAYVVHEWQQSGLAPSDISAYVRKMYDTYKPKAMVGDSGGIGLAFIAEWNKWNPKIPLLSAVKAEKRGRVEFVSDLLYTASEGGGPGDEYNRRRGLFSLRSCPQVNAQLASLMWNDDRSDLAEGQDDHLVNALVYGLSVCPIWANEAMPEYGELKHPDPAGQRYGRYEEPPDPDDADLADLAAGWQSSRLGGRH